MSTPPSPPTYVNGHSHVNGSDLGLGILLGQILSRSEEQVSILRDIREVKQDQSETLARLSDRVEALPAAVAAKLPAPAAKPTSRILPLMREFLQALVPLAILAALVAGKITWADAMPHLLKSVGVP